MGPYRELSHSTARFVPIAALYQPYRASCTARCVVPASTARSVPLPALRCTAQGGVRTAHVVPLAGLYRSVPRRYNSGVPVLT
eukprot:543835-Rhodomonas_salina.2